MSVSGEQLAAGIMRGLHTLARIVRVAIVFGSEIAKNVLLENSFLKAHAMVKF